MPEVRRRIRDGHHWRGADEGFGLEAAPRKAEPSRTGRIIRRCYRFKREACGVRPKALEEGAHVLISMAGEGALFITADRVYHAGVPSGTVRNSVGAGDSMIAGFVGTLAMGKDSIEAFRTGVASGSATAFSDDLAVRDTIDRLLPQVRITEW